jgi:PKHD-type hydroxylase
MNTVPSTVWAFEGDSVNNWAYMDNAFSKEECERIIDIGNKKTLQKTRIINDSGEAVIANSIRDSEITWLTPADDMEWAYRRLTDVVTSLNRQFFNFDLMGFSEGLQFTKYTAPGGFYGPHLDKIMGRVVRKLSISVQLSDPLDYDGGELELHMKQTPDLMSKDQGRLVAFPSYLLHEVKPVTRGTRYSLVAWITGAPFK